MPSSYTAPGLDEAEASKVRDALQNRLVALLDTQLTLKHIHWNVVGPNFIGVHEMIDPQYAEVAAMVDAVAERIATLGGSPKGTPGAVVSERTWDDYKLDRALTHEHLAALDHVYVGLIEDHRKAIKISGDIDPVTEDLLIGQTNQLELFHWFVRAHLEDKSGNISS
ncbi:DNA starvation/stationary phase protection protein [Aquihabitans sp. G128]|uniref:Dps family protein n=1 Tax=Aquihabitans sp. G128 TaxID=2849779 RepID=UPI001C24528C|nr:DNA starvation/stationary phase protection protein [Aquihabitans sp. G128]QXC59250.1 DNA starvation/stationary phase protection protein [Aquihabitans sp. G128]